MKAGDCLKKQIGKSRFSINSLEAPCPISPSTSPTPIKNSFSALAEDDSTSISGELLDQLNGWAHKVSRKSSKKARPVVVSKPPDAETQQKIRQVIKTRPAELECDENEVLCLVDSGSTVNAAWISRHFPQYSAMVKPTPSSERGEGATTACGRELLNKGRCVVSGSVQDSPYKIAFKDMEVEIPILSVRKMVRRNNQVKFNNRGGTITNKTSGRQIRFHEHEGVYFLKLKVDGPDADTSQLGFTRPGRP